MRCSVEGVHYTNQGSALYKVTLPIKQMINKTCKVISLHNSGEGGKEKKKINMVDIPFPGQAVLHSQQIHYDNYIKASFPKVSYLHFFKVTTENSNIYLSITIWFSNI